MLFHSYTLLAFCFFVFIHPTTTFCVYAVENYFVVVNLQILSFVEMAETFFKALLQTAVHKGINGALCVYLC